MGYKQFSYLQALFPADASARPGELPQPELLRPSELREIALLTTIYFTGSHFASLMLDRLQQELSRLGYRLNTDRVSPEELETRSLPFAFCPEQTAGILCIEMFDWDVPMRFIKKSYYFRIP